MKNGYADFHIINTDALYRPDRQGYIITITVDEGPQYHVSGVNVNRIFAACRGDRCNQFVTLASPATSITPTAVEKTVDAHDPRTGARGFAFSEVRPRGERDAGDPHRSSLVFMVEDGPRSMSNASMSAATPAPAITSSAASSISAKATPITRRWSTGPSAA